MIWKSNAARENTCLKKLLTEVKSDDSEKRVHFVQVSLWTKFCVQTNDSYLNTNEYKFKYKFESDLFTKKNKILGYFDLIC